MAIPSRQIGWGTEDNLLWQISKQLQRLTQVTGNIITPIPTLQAVCDTGAIVLNAPITLNSNDNTLQVFSEAQIAITAQGSEVAGVKGASDNGFGVWGISQQGIGGYFQSLYGYGVYATSQEEVGVNGGSTGGYGVYGTSVNSIGGFFSSINDYSLVANGTAAKPGGGSWSVYSDSRIKENIISYTKGLSDILLINPVTYEYNGLAGTTKGKKYTGIIAQEIKEVFPETVNIYKAKLNEEDKEKTELYDFNSSDLTFALINAVKELKAEIDLLKAK